MKLPELKSLMKEHGIGGWSTMNKLQIVNLLTERGIVTEEKPATLEKDIDPKYRFLQDIRTHPRKVEVRDLETNEVTTYPSMHKAGRALCVGASTIKHNNGKVWRGRYAIRIY